MQIRRSVTKSFRLDADLVDDLERVAKREGISENSFVQGILSRRMRADPLIRAFPLIVLSRTSFVQILGTANRASLEIAGAELGKRNFSLSRSIYQSMGDELNYLRWVVEVLANQAHWFETDGADERTGKLTLHHEYGTKWSVFLGSFLPAAFEVMSNDKVKVSLANEYVSVELPSAPRRHDQYKTSTSGDSV
jgi:hypothetical protein